MLALNVGLTIESECISDGLPQIFMVHRTIFHNFPNHFRNRQYWHGMLTGIRKEAYEKAKPPKKELPFNVIMFGFDSLSRNAWIRKLPKSYEYMKKYLHADVLQGYNIVGDGTPQALIPVCLIV